jgi:hypothetical protein
MCDPGQQRQFDGRSTISGSSPPFRHIRQDGDFLFCEIFCPFHFGRLHVMRGARQVSALFGIDRLTSLTAPSH